MRENIFSQETVNNKDEAIFYINELYRIDNVLYSKIKKSLKSNSELLPASSEIDCQAGATAGEIFNLRLENKFPGSDNANRRITLHNIKHKFKKAYATKLGFPDISYASKRNLADEQVAVELINHRVLTIIGDYEKNIIHFLFHKMNENLRIIWLDQINTSDADIYSLIKKKLKIHFNNDLNLDDLFSAKTQYEFIILIPVTEDVSKKLNTKVEEITSSISDDSFIRFLLIEKPSSDVNSEVQLSLAKENKFGEKFKKKPIYILVILIVIFSSTFFVYNFLNNTGLKLEFYFYSDEAVFDYFNEGVRINLYNSSGNLLKYLETEYNHEIELPTQNSSIEKIEVTRGLYEITPSTLLVKNYNANDYLRLYFIRKIVPNDILNNSIFTENAQRWFVFEVKERSYFKAICIADDYNFSPQVAIYNKLVSGEKVSESHNFAGRVTTDSTYCYLNEGKYYLKVRGFDKSHGKFLLVTKIKAVF